MNTVLFNYDSLQKYIVLSQIDSHCFFIQLYDSLKYTGYLLTLICDSFLKDAILCCPDAFYLNAFLSLNNSLIYQVLIK